MIDWNLYLDRAKQNHLPNAGHINVSEVISHGDMIYLLPTMLTSGQEQATRQEKFEEDEVDLYLSKHLNILNN